MSSVFRKALIAIVQNPILISKLKGVESTAVVKTSGGEEWWKNLENFQGWKLQINKACGKCRLLDSNNLRRVSWLNEASMYRTCYELFGDKSSPQTRLIYSDYGQSGNNNTCLNKSQYDRSVDASNSDWYDYIEYNRG